MASPEHTFPASHVLHVVEVARRWNVSAEQLLAPFGLREQELEDPSARIGSDVLAGISERARQLTGEPGIGFYLGLHKRLTLYGQLGFAAMTASTVREWLTLAERYAPVVSSAVGFALELDGKRAAVRIEERCDLGSAHDIGVFSLIVGFRQLATVLTGRAPGRIVVDIPFAKPDYFDRFAHLLPDARFSCDQLRIHFDARALDVPLLAPDRAALRSAIEACERQLATLVVREDLAQRVRALVLEEGSVRSIEAVARALHLSTRTLKRKLAAEGTSFTELVERERQERAVVLLRDADVTLEEVASRLGYATVPSFARAFRRWMGSAPAEYRAKVRR
jgi:AraC-like DNA-binding protein